MMKTQGNKPSCEMRNSKNEAKGEVWTPCVPVASDILLPSSLQWKAEKLTVAGQILRLSTGGKKQPSIFTYGFLESEAGCKHWRGLSVRAKQKKHTSVTMHTVGCPRPVSGRHKTQSWTAVQVVCNEGDGFASLQIAALNGPHAAPAPT